MRIAVVCTRFPWPLEKGDKLRLYHLIKDLSKEHQIFLHAITSDEPADKGDMEKLCHSIYIYSLSKWERYIQIAMTFFGKLPAQVAWFYNRGIKKKLRNNILKEDPDLVFTMLARAAPYTECMPLPKVLDYQDCFSGIAYKRAQMSPWLESMFYSAEADKMMDYEREIYRRYDKHIIISEADKKKMPLASVDRIEVVSNGVDTQYFSVRKVKEITHDIVFVGNLGYHPNAEAAKYLLQHLGEDHTILIGGARPGEKLKEMITSPHQLVANAGDIREVYMRGRIFVAPIFYGGGQQNKLLEAMSMGIPVITTTQAAGALRAVEGEHLLTAHNAASLKSEVKRLLKDKELCERLSANGRKLMEEEFSWSAVVSTLTGIFEAAIKKSIWSRF